MIEQIGETAGKIWKLLEEKGEVSISQIPKALNEKQVVVYQSLGWLARENKIQYRSEKNKVLVSIIMQS